jgi:predicted O-methyltransferase YrrM
VTTSRREQLFALADRTKGFMPQPEGLALFEHGLVAGQHHPGGTWLEIGSWCGKSTLYLGAAAEETSCVLYSLDHHHGSEENQAGWEHFDASLVDPVDGRLNTLPTWQRTVANAALESDDHRTRWFLDGRRRALAQPLDLLFIDGGHGHDVAWADYEGVDAQSGRRWTAAHSRRLRGSSRRRASAVRDLSGGARK